ncbi:hypothetical protein I79_013255 [Cricetulus griseus]|uniref:Uncharacterized protein n=1 Tax=Cricetulus griseus TaxID=10029 RepID=G3HQZ6_CRIGR|nr:hypothetical protein I79_013255 [Cricetulus griseus]
MTAHDGEDVEKGEHSSIAGGSANLYTHCGNQYGDFFRKLRINLPQNSALPLWGIYPKKALCCVNSNIICNNEILEST